MKPIKRLLLTLVVLAALVLGAGLWLDAHYVVPVLMYHRVEARDTPVADTVSPRNFDRQMRFLAERGYVPIGLDELVAGTRAGRRFSRRSVVVTFDDGYDNNFSEAYPVLKKYAIPATIFISPSFVGKEGFMSWPQILAMQEGGIAFGSHGMTQAYLPDCTPRELSYEINDSKRVLQKNLKTEVKQFAYPVGGFSDKIKNAMRQAGYEAALATNRGYDRMNRDVFEINRVRLSDKDNTDFILWAKLSGYYNLFRKTKKPY